MPLKKSRDQFIKEATIKHKGKYAYDNVVYNGSDVHVSITCKDHNDFPQTPHEHLNGKGCPKCAIINSRTQLDDFIRRAREKHGDKYGYDKVNIVDVHTDVIIYCPIHQDFKQAPRAHLRGECKQCSNENRRLTREQFIAKAIKVHGDKFDYSTSIFVDTKTALNIVCKEAGHVTKLAPKHHISGQGCKECNRLAKCMGVEEFIRRASILHDGIYNYDNVVYVNNRTEVIIGCPEGHTFKQTPDHHLQGHNCNICVCNQGANLEIFIMKANAKHNNMFDYSLSVYVNNRIKLKIICKNGHQFEQTPLGHLQGQGCTKCLNCPSCGLFRTCHKLCDYCKPPTESKSFRKSHEMATVNFLKEKLPDVPFIHNKSVGMDCTGSHIFPDILYDRGTHFIAVEVDEHEHRASSYRCEQQRMLNIIANLGLPCVFIRYNPDHKDSNLDVLLKCLVGYFNIDTFADESNCIEYRDFGCITEYLYYT